MSSSSDRDLTENENRQSSATLSGPANRKMSQSKQYKTKFNSALLRRYNFMKPQDDFSTMMDPEILKRGTGGGGVKGRLLRKF